MRTPRHVGHEDILARFVNERGLRRFGFAKALRDIAEARVVARIDDDDKGTESELNELIDYEFEELFGHIKCRPAAFYIEDAKQPFFFTLHLYEFAFRQPPAFEKICQYGLIADGDGPFVILHIVDYLGNERLLSNDDLATFGCFSGHSPRVESWLREEWKAISFSLPRAKKSEGGHQRGLPDLHTSKQVERAILTAVYESGLINPGEVK